jgi:hypothetical protein
VRVWVDFTNTAHVVVLRPLVEALEADGHEVALTARPLSHTVQLLEDWGHPHVVLGRHGGASRAGKVRAAADRVRRMVGFGRGRRFDAAFAHGSTDLPVACRALGVPNTTMLDYEFALAQHRVNGVMANRVLAPEAVPLERMARLGVRPPKLVRYPGLKEEYLLHGFEPDPAVLDEVGVDPARPIAVVRTAPSYALYLGGAESALLPRLLAHLDGQGAQVVVLPRTPEQGEAVRALSLPSVVVPPRAVESRSLVAYADVLVSAGGSMNREAAALGTPVWTMFEGRMGGVDERLIADGRLRVLERVEDVVVDRRAGDGRAPRRPATTRDPRELLRLALP